MKTSMFDAPAVSPSISTLTGSGGQGRRSIQETVYDALRESILNLTLPPNSEISEKDMAVRYAVSRTPVREAFIHLAQEGLIRVVPQKRTLVSLIDFARVEQEFFLRERLELAVLELFLQNSSEQDFTDMENLIDKQQQAVESGNYLELMTYDDAFHRILYTVAKQPLCNNVVEMMNGHYYRVRLLTTWISGIAGDVVIQHRHILNALRQGNLDEARHLLTAHLGKLTVEEKILRIEFPTFFTAS
ncbi:MAG: GntR family transcriptional regulator [Treponemataceae bacterium]|nr:MAG: GntR family transcriptional regulator [Treponemataceae bacterium]